MTNKRKACVDMKGLSSSQKDKLIEELDKTASEFRRKILDDVSSSEETSIEDGSDV